MTKSNQEQQIEIVGDEEVPAHLFDESQPEVRIHRFGWSASRTGFGGLVRAVLGGFVVLGTVVFALVGLWLFLLLAFAFGIVAVIGSLFSPTGRRG